MKVDIFFSLGQFDLWIFHNDDSTGFGFSYPFFSLRYWCMDRANYRWHWCSHKKDENGFCVHRPFNFKGGKHALEIIKAFELGEDLKHF